MKDTGDTGPASKFESGVQIYWNTYQAWNELSKERIKYLGKTLYVSCV